MTLREIQSVIAAQTAAIDPQDAYQAGIVALDLSAAAGQVAAAVLAYLEHEEADYAEALDVALGAVVESCATLATLLDRDLETCTLDAVGARVGVTVLTGSDDGDSPGLDEAEA